MTKDSKTLAEYYALGAINLQQLLDGVSKDENLREILEYAILYAEDYNTWCKSRKEREDQIEEDWKWFQQHRHFFSAGTVFTILEDEENERFARDWETADRIINGVKWSDTDLQAAYNADYLSRSKQQIRRIAKEAYHKKISIPTINRFFKEYKLNCSEMTCFWLAYFTESISI